jgi:hypothetical protein
MHTTIALKHNLALSSDVFFSDLPFSLASASLLQILSFSCIGFPSSKVANLKARETVGGFGKGFMDGAKPAKEEEEEEEEIEMIKPKDPGSKNRLVLLSSCPLVALLHFVTLGMPCTSPFRYSWHALHFSISLLLVLSLHFSSPCSSLLLAVLLSLQFSFPCSSPLLAVLLSLQLFLAAPFR